MPRLPNPQTSKNNKNADLNEYLPMVARWPHRGQ
jgi:hypothetical protein